MFVHSIKVPRMYKIAAKILQEVKENRGSLKQLLYSNKHSNVKAIYALIVETLKHFSQIDTLIEQSQLLINEQRFDPWLARIFITELLWNEKPLAGECKPIKTIMSYYDVLKEHKLILDSKTEQKIAKKVQKPRFVRINTLAINLEEVINGFREEEWKLVPSSSQTYDEYLSKSNSLGPDEFMIDLHIKELLLFPFNTTFYNHYAYKKGLIILQDKASCLPACLLNPPPGSTVLDMCAAPGMKTTHLAAVLNNEGTVYAVERDSKRFETLNKMVESAGATCVKTINKDVLKITPDDCPNVEYILVDPSCSGSGIANRIEVDDENTNADPVRLKRLTNFQAQVLKHAFTCFPQAKRVVYSTCSVYPEENENVVKDVQDIGNFKLISAKSLLNGPWKSSASEHYDAITDKCLYTKPEEDLTNGFFIAVFEREVVQDPSQFGKAEGHENDLKMADYRKKKKGKRNIHINEEVSFQIDKDSVLDVPENSLKRKYKEKPNAGDERTGTVEEERDNVVPKKKKKKNKKESKQKILNIENNTQNYENIEATRTVEEEHENNNLEPKKKKKKNKKESKEKILNTENSIGNNKNIEVNKEYTEEVFSGPNVHKKHKKKNKDQSENEEIIKGVGKVEKKKKIKNKESFSQFASIDINEKQECENKPTKKSKKHKKVDSEETIKEKREREKKK